MRMPNFAMDRRAAGFIRVCLGVAVLVTMSAGGMALNSSPVQATSIAPAGPLAYNVPVCQPWQQQFTIGPTCAPGSVFYWLVGATPAFVSIDMNTGLLTACPDAASAGTSSNFQVWCTEFSPPFCFGWASADVTLNFQANAAACVTSIDPTFYPVAWENMPFTMTLSATGGVGPLSWSAAGLPSGLAVTDTVNGIISGTPAPGTCGIYTVTVSVIDTGTCTSCCPTISRPFFLFVDCWANYLALMTTYTASGCDFKVNIGPGLAYGSTSVMVDGKFEAALAGNGSESFTSVPCQSHLVVVDATVQGPDPKTRYACIGSNQKWVTDIDSTAYFDYAPEIWIDTASEPPGVAQPPNSGFYAMGSGFSTSAPSPVEPVSQQGSKYIFKSWRLPDGSTGANRDLRFAVNRAGTATAIYDTYYLLQLKSDYPAVNESSWEMKDSTARYDLALQPVPMSGFWGLLGGVLKPVNGSGSHIMDGPYTQNIVWSDDYTVPVIVIVVSLLIIATAVFFLLRRKGPAAPAKPVAAKPAVQAVDKNGPAEAGPKVKPEFCPNCGNPVDADAGFCKKCGHKL